MTDLQSWEEDKGLYLFTSLTAGSSHVITATSRIETILKNARIPFTYVDTATNESAKKLFQRRGKGKKLPLLVKAGFVIADLEQVEDWNEFGELKESIGPVATSSTSVTTTPAKQPTTGASSSAATPTKAPPSESTAATASSQDATGAPSAVALALRKAAFESASAAKERQASGASGTAPKASGSTTTAADSLTLPKASSGSDVEAALPSPSRVPLPMSPTTPQPASARSLYRRHGSSTSSLGTEGKQYVPEHFDPPPTTHRGSSVSLVSDEEIKEIESKQTILEESEESEDEEDEEDDSAQTTAKPAAAKVASQPETKPKSKANEPVELEAKLEDIKLADSTAKKQ